MNLADLPTVQRLVEEQRHLQKELDLRVSMTGTGLWYWDGKEWRSRSHVIKRLTAIAEELKQLGVEE